MVKFQSKIEEEEKEKLQKQQQKFVFFPRVHLLAIFFSSFIITYLQSSYMENLQLEERRKRKTLNPKALFPVHVPITVVLTPSARFQCEGIFLRAVCNMDSVHVAFLKRSCICFYLH